jgi:hypothetical protein
LVTRNAGAEAAGLLAGVRRDEAVVQVVVMVPLLVAVTLEAWATAGVLRSLVCWAG